jgi:1-acyl-sn-glycerol-3-phosphate acyltransferase
MFLKLIQNLWLKRLTKLSNAVVYGKNNIPKQDGFIVAFNHDGYWDGEFVLYAFKGKIIHFFYDIPPDIGKYFLKWWYRGKGLGVTDKLPNKKEINRQALNNAVDLLLKNQNIGIAPQGPNGLKKYVESIKRPFYPGCAIISCKSGKPVVPVRILNDETYIYDYPERYIPISFVIKTTMKRIKDNVKNGKNVIILIGKPIYPDVTKYNENKREYISEFTSVIKDKIYDLEKQYYKGTCCF